MQDELVSNGGALVSANACAQCLAGWGMDPQVAGVVAVLLGVVVRLALDALARRARRREAAPGTGGAADGG